MVLRQREMLLKECSDVLKRDNDLLKKLAEAYSNKEIGLSFGITESTIRKHRENIYKKLEINNILELEKFHSAFELIGAI